MSLKRVEVVAAIIVRDGSILATERGYGEWEGWWEFPGGKVEPGEAPEEALVREMVEELNAEIAVDSHLCTVEHEYPSFLLHMRCYVCHLIDPSLELREHHAARWLTREHLDEVGWLPADVKVVEAIKDTRLI